MAKSTFNNLNEEKKLKIINELIELYSTVNYEDINVSLIVTTCNLARGSFYQYFQDVKDVTFTLIDYLLSKYSDSFIYVDKDLFELNRYILEQQLIHNQDKCFHDFMKNIYKAGDLELISYIDAIKDDHYNKVLEYSLATLDFKDSSLKNIELVSLMLMSTLHTLIKKSYRNENKVEETLEAYDMIVTAIKYGCLKGN